MRKKERENKVKLNKKKTERGRRAEKIQKEGGGEPYRKKIERDK